MSARTPEELCQRFVESFTAGDLDTLVALYEPQAVLLPQPGHVARGHAAIRESLAAFVSMGGTFRMSPPKVIHGDGVAILYADWTLDAKASDGGPIALAGQTTDVARRQADGRWLYAIDSPFGANGAT